MACCTIYRESMPCRHNISMHPGGQLSLFIYVIRVTRDKLPSIRIEMAIHLRSFSQWANNQQAAAQAEPAAQPASTSEGQCTPR